MKKLNKGDVIKIKRLTPLSPLKDYYHYGVYAGDNKVYHFASKNGDFFNGISIHKGTLKEFLGLSSIEKVEVVKFKNSASPEETIRRAELAASGRGDFIGNYNLVTRNCEHFARYCKTGVPKSKQVEDFIGDILTGGVWSKLTKDESSLGEKVVDFITVGNGSLMKECVHSDKSQKTEKIIDLTTNILTGGAWSIVKKIFC